MARGVGRSSGELTSSAPEGADLVSSLLIADMSNEITREGGGWAGGPGVAHSKASGLNVSFRPDARTGVHGPHAVVCELFRRELIQKRWAVV